MIYRVRTLNAVPEKEQTLREVMAGAAAYASQKFPGIEVEILENVSGPRRQYHMVTRCDSLAALEQYEVAREGDAGWLAWIDKARELAGVVDSSDSLYRVVEPATS